MKVVYTAKHPTEAHLVKGMLQAEGIRAEVRGDQLYGAYGELPILPTVWIYDDAHAAEAERLVIDFLRGGAARRYGHQRWTCAQCGEVLEGQFTDCWKCGAPRPA
jgi:putative signal transducing protein